MAEDVAAVAAVAAAARQDSALLPLAAQAEPLRARLMTAGRRVIRAPASGMVYFDNDPTGTVVAAGGEVARVVVQLERELPIEEGMRVVVRERGRTVGAGLMENVA